MKLDYEDLLQRLEREQYVRISEKEREILVLKSELVRKDEQKDDNAIGSKKLQIKFEQETYDQQ